MMQGLGRCMEVLECASGGRAGGAVRVPRAPARVAHKHSAEEVRKPTNARNATRKRHELALRVYRIRQNKASDFRNKGAGSREPRPGFSESGHVFTE